jgi:hypothetical protein
VFAGIRIPTRCFAVKMPCNHRVSQTRHDSSPDTISSLFKFLPMKTA